MVIATDVFAASALAEPGTAKTLRLDGRAQSEDGLDRRELALVVDIVVDE
jgi:hypothetical protein